jgi:hypothetical protein
MTMEMIPSQDGREHGVFTDGMDGMELIPTTFGWGSGVNEWNFNEIAFTSDKLSTSLFGCAITKTIHLKQALSTDTVCFGKSKLFFASCTCSLVRVASSLRK